jgi:hypothetical protein
VQIIAPVTTVKLAPPAFEAHPARTTGIIRSIEMHGQSPYNK